MSAAFSSGLPPRESLSLLANALPASRIKVKRSCCDHPHPAEGSKPEAKGHAHCGHGHDQHDHGRAHHHGHHHAPGGAKDALAAPIYQTFRAAQLGAEAKEGCACCSGGGVPDGPDEVVSALSTGKNAAGTPGHDGHVHGHTHAGFSWPDTPGEVGLGVAMGAFAGLGFYVGWKNFKQAWDSSRVLGDDKSGKIAANLAKEKDAQDAIKAAVIPSASTAAQEAPKAKLDRLARQRVKNLQAHGSNLWGSKSMQRFIQVFSGGTVMGSAALVAGGVFMPLLAAVGTGVQIVYCAAHIGRYLGWELGRTKPTARLKNPDAAGALAKRGMEIFDQRQRHRAGVFSGTSACFVAYGVGACLLTANAVLGVGMALLAPGVGLFLAGMLSVLVLNNKHIISTFFNNNETDLEREHQGTKEAQLRRLAHFTDEKARLGGLVQQLRDGGLVASRDSEFWGWTQAGKHAARTRVLRKAAPPAVEGHRRRAIVAFMAASAASRRTFVREALTATQQERATYARKVGHVSASKTVAADTLKALDARAAAEQRQEAALSESLLPALGRAQAPGATLSDADYFSLLWGHLASLDDGMPARALAAGTPDAQDHLNRVTVTVAESQRTQGVWWRSIPGGKALRPEALRRAMLAGDSRAIACAKAFCEAAQLYLLYTYPDVLTQQTGSLVDHLAERMKHSGSPKAFSVA